VTRAPWMAAVLLAWVAVAAAAEAPSGEVASAEPPAVDAALADVPAAGASPAREVAPASAGEGGRLLQEVRENRRRLWTAHMDTPPASAPSVNLEEAVRRLREAICRPIPRPRPAPSADAGVPEAEPPKSGALPAAPVEPKPKPVLPPEELQRLKALGLTTLDEPLALADALFLGGHLPEASAVYERLLAEGRLGGLDQAWALFQAANCKRAADAAGALALYDRLLSEHPECPWTEVAKVRKTIVQWRRQAGLEALLAPVGPPTRKPEHSTP